MILFYLNMGYMIILNVSLCILVSKITSQDCVYYFLIVRLTHILINVSCFILTYVSDWRQACEDIKHIRLIDDNDMIELHLNTK